MPKWGECITCSIGIAPNRYLAKTASDLTKPDGLEVARLGYRAREMSLGARVEGGPRVEAGLRFAPVTDSHALLGFLVRLWAEVLEQTGHQRIKKISVTLHGLEALDMPEQLDLFPALGSPVTADRARRERLSQVMDEMNQKFGRDSISLGFAPDSVKVFSGTKIAFTRIPDMREFQE